MHLALLATDLFCKVRSTPLMQHIFSFKEGNVKMKDLLGGKGANLADMTSMGLPVPAGFTITTET
ncbi:MAG: PEP/pyruvate-binding domain-containing protein, partial [Patescibacteria group bacterium]